MSYGRSGGKGAGGQQPAPQPIEMGCVTAKAIIAACKGQDATELSQGDLAQLGAAKQHVAKCATCKSAAPAPGAGTPKPTSEPTEPKTDESKKEEKKTSDFDADAAKKVAGDGLWALAEGFTFGIVRRPKK